MFLDSILSLFPDTMSTPVRTAIGFIQNLNTAITAAESVCHRTRDSGLTLSTGLPVMVSTMNRAILEHGFYFSIVHSPEGTEVLVVKQAS